MIRLPKKRILINTLAMSAIQPSLQSLSQQLNLNDHDLQFFGDWMTAKKMSESAFPFLKLVKTDTDLSLWIKGLYHCSLLNLTFSETLQTMELFTDLLLMGHNEILFEKSQNRDQWKNHLHQLRYPMTAEVDQQLKQKLENLPWPVGAKIKFERRGDRAGVEVKMFISSSADLTKVISSLERVKENL